MRLGAGRAYGWAGFPISSHDPPERSWGALGLRQRGALGRRTVGGKASCAVWVRGRWGIGVWGHRIPEVWVCGGGLPFYGVGAPDAGGAH